MISTSAISTCNIGQALRTSAAEKSSGSESQDAITTTGESATEASDSTGEVSMTVSLPLEVKTGEVTTATATTTAVKSVTDAPVILTLPEEEEIYESVSLGENIQADIYGNGLMRIHGYGEMNNFSKTPFVNAAAVTQVLFEDEDAEKGIVITSIGNYLFNGMNQLNGIVKKCAVRKYPKSWIGRSQAAR